MKPVTNWIDRFTAPVAPRWTLKRQRARVAGQLLARHYDGASSGRRTQGWRRNAGDANAVVGPALARLREAARDLVRNNPYAESALNTICNHTVASGIVARPDPANKAALDVWNEWAGSVTCDADGRHDFAGLQKLVMRTVVESGEVLARRRIRFVTDGFPLNLQVQLLDPDFLDTSKDSLTAVGTQNRLVQGVEFDAIGRRRAYWLFSEHPGSAYGGAASSQAVPAESVLHVFHSTRPGQVRGPSWFAPVLMRAKDFDEYEDATLMKQKVAACLAVIMSDPDGSATGLGTVDDSSSPAVDMLEPGGILNVPQGRRVDIVNPPSVNDYEAYGKSQLRAIATGLGVTYEDLTGDYGELSFSAARMSKISHWSRVEDWRWKILVPQFCDPVWNWVMQAAVVAGRLAEIPKANWTAEPAPMIDPVNEGLAYQRRVRNGLVSLSEALRELGYDPETVFAEMQADNAKLDALGIILDSDPRKMTQAGQLQGEAAVGVKADPAPEPAPPPPDPPKKKAARKR